MLRLKSGGKSDGADFDGDSKTGSRRQPSALLLRVLPLLIRIHFLLLLGVESFFIGEPVCSHFSGDVHFCSGRSRFCKAEEHLQAFRGRARKAVLFEEVNAAVGRVAWFADLSATWVFAFRPVQDVGACLHKLLGAVLLLEDRMTARTEAVVDHDLCRGEELVQRKRGVVREGRGPRSTVQCFAREPNGGSGDDGRRVTDESVVHGGDLHAERGERWMGQMHVHSLQHGPYSQEFGHGTRLDVVVISLGDATEEVHRVGVAKVEAERPEDVAFCSKDLILRKSGVGEVVEVLDGRAHDLFILGSDEESRAADELELADGDVTEREQAVKDVDGEIERLRDETELLVSVDQPINQGATVFPRDFALVSDVVSIGHALDLAEVDMSGLDR